MTVLKYKSKKHIIFSLGLILLLLFLKPSWHVLTLAPSYIFNSSPPVENHGCVMVDMEEGQLTVLLPQDEKHLSHVNTHKEKCKKTQLHDYVHKN